MSERLRIGILCDGLEFQRWQVACIRAVLAVPGVDPVLIVVNGTPAATRAPFLQRILRHPWRIALFLLYRKRWFRPASMELEDLSTELAHVHRQSCKPERDGHGNRFSKDDLDAIARHAPDVLLRFGFGILKGAVLTLPRHGVWSYHHGDEEKYRGQPPGFWEIMHEEPVTGAILQRLTDRLDAGHVLRKGWFRTDQGSLEATLDTVRMGSAGWAALVCKELLSGSADAAIGTPSTTNAPIRKYPGNFAFLSWWLKVRENRSRIRRYNAMREEWNLGVLYQPIHRALDARPSLNVRWLPAPSPGQVRRSPAGYEADGQLNVLYSKYDHSTGIGEISRLRPKRDNILKRSRTMLDGDHQPRCPFVLEHNGTVYVIPEEHARGRVDLYRVNEANDALEFVRTLLGSPLLAPTLFEHAGLWWLLGTREPPGDPELHAFHADRMEGPYAAHAGNPVKTDVRSARPAGTPFVHEGLLYRPACDQSNATAPRTVLNRVLELSPSTFREEVARTIGPYKGTPWSQGACTFNAVGDITLVDGLRLVSPGEAQGHRKKHRSSSRSGKSVKKSMEEEEDEDSDE